MLAIQIHYVATALSNQTREGDELINELMMSLQKAEKMIPKFIGDYQAPLDCKQRYLKVYELSFDKERAQTKMCTRKLCMPLSRIRDEQQGKCVGARQ